MKLELCAAFLTTIAAVGCSTATSGGNKDAEKLTGNWKCVSATVNGKALPADTVGQLQLDLTTSRYQTKKGEQVLFDSEYSLDSSRKPKEINIIGTEGDLAGKAALGIYELSGDSLTLCYTMPGKERPKTFQSSGGSEAHLITWKRAR
jgi:uncharacterized protein (TIGR03067 family)